MADRLARTKVLGVYTLTERTPHHVSNQVAAWDEDYILLPGAYEVTEFDGRRSATVKAEVVYAKKASLLGGLPIGKFTGPDAGTVIDLTLYGVRPNDPQPANASAAPVVGPNEDSPSP